MPSQVGMDDVDNRPYLMGKVAAIVDVRVKFSGSFQIVIDMKPMPDRLARKANCGGDGCRGSTYHSTQRYILDSAPGETVVGATSVVFTQCQGIEY